MGEWTPWSEAEIDKFVRYFRGNWQEMTLFQHLVAINPSRTFESMTRHIRRMKKTGWQKKRTAALSRLRIGYLDIETTGLDANFGMMLCWCIKTRSKKEIREAVITKAEIFDGKQDRRITEELLRALDHYDVLCLHYGTDRRFDVPFIRTRALYHDIAKMLPRHGEKYMIDTWPICRNKLRLGRNSLQQACDLAGVKSVRKTPLLPSHWQKARYGDKKSLEYILEHCRHDVLLLERLHKKLEPIQGLQLKSM